MDQFKRDIFKNLDDPPMDLNRSSPGDLINVVGNQTKNLKLSDRGSQVLIGSGNETFDTILGGGLLMSTLNLFELSNRHTKPVGAMMVKTFASCTLSCDQHLIIINCMDELTKIDRTNFLLELPLRLKIPIKKLKQDINSIKSLSDQERIKIAWRYRTLDSPSDMSKTVDQVNFGVRMLRSADVAICMRNESYSNLHIIEASSVANIGHGKLKVNLNDLNQIIQNIINHINSISIEDARTNNVVTVIVVNATNPSSCIPIDLLPNFLYRLKSMTRIKKNCTVIIEIESELVDMASILQRMRDISDSVIEFSSFIDPKNSPYLEYDGIIKILKLAKINSNSFHFERDVCDWGYRQTRDTRYLVFDRLSLPPCDDVAKEAVTQDEIPTHSRNQLGVPRPKMACVSFISSLDNKKPESTFTSDGLGSLDDF